MAIKKTTVKVSSDKENVKKAVVKKALTPTKKKVITKKTTIKKTAAKKTPEHDLFGKVEAVKKVAKKTVIKKAATPTESKSTPKKAIIKKAVSKIKNTSAIDKKTEIKAVVKKEISKNTAVKKVVADKIVKEKKEYIKDIVDEVRELPDRYNETKLVLMIRDPQWCYFYWDISDDDRKRNNIEHTPLSVKIFKLSGIDITKNEQHVEVNVGHYFGDWFINLNSPNTYFIAEIGYYIDGKFIVLARSNIVYAPRDSMSSVFDDEYMVNEELMKVFYDTSTFVFSLSSMSILQILELKGLGGSSSSLFIPRKDN